MADPARPGPWQQDAACTRQTDTMVIPDRRDPNRRLGIAKAKAICDICPVHEQCREWGLTSPDPSPWMIAGGMTPKERQAERSGGLICGTDSGYARHYRRNEPACGDCKAAHRDAARHQRARLTWERDVTG